MEGVVIIGEDGCLRQSQTTASIAWKFQRTKMLLNQTVDIQGQKYNTKLRLYLWGPALKTN